MARELRYLEGSKAFALTTDDGEFAKRLKGEGWATDTGHRRGGWRLFTREPYAAVHYVRWADEGTRDRLLPLAQAYRDSLALENVGYDYPYTSRTGDEFAPFQKAGVRYALERPHCLIGDDMGVGKTAQAVVYANELRAERVLVVCPGRVRLQWQNQVRSWSSIRRLQTYPILKSADGVNPFAHWTLISYDLLRKDALRSALDRLPRFDLLVLDEAHYLKTIDTQRTRAVFGDLRGAVEGVSARSDRILALTGTPLPNRPRECYVLARHLCWPAIDWQSEEAFRRRYNPSAELWNGHTLEEVGRLPELRARLRCNFMVRRTFDAVQPQLPKMGLELAYLEPNGEIRKALRAERLLDIDVDDLENLDMEARGHVATVRREMGIAKTPRVVEHVSMLLEGGLEKVFVVAYHREVMKLLAERLASHGCAVITGGQTQAQQDREKARFVGDPNCRVCLGQLQVAGLGLDGLQKVCHHGVFAEASWVSGDNEQVTRRLRRMGQGRRVLWQFAVAPGSLDERILGRAIDKGQKTHETLDGGEN